MSIGTIPVSAARRATLDDLAKVDGKAELINGRIVHDIPTGYLPSRVASRICRSLDDDAEMTGRGVVFTHNLVFAITELPSGRESFSPDASFYDGPLPANPMAFIQGAPTLAVEVRSESDYGETAEESMAAKRTDYFLAGTLVVWDVDVVSRWVRKYAADLPEQPIVFGPGEQADAEPAVPGWRMPVDRIFP